jgi:predicted ATPase/anti-anti-sigma regulatory factor/GAF domain-containing protein
MNKLPSYSLLDKFHDGSNTQLFYGIREADGTPVVIKVARSEYPGVRELARLQNEYLLLRELAAPGIPKAYGLEKFGRGVALVMQRVAGQPLHALLRSRQLTISECLRIAIELARILEGVHSHHIVHRDVKPSNILIDMDPPPGAEAGGVTLVDFGIATYISPDVPAIQSPDLFSGTPAYMAPEQSGRVHRVVDARTDLYSLGVTLFEMLTGALPFPGADPAEFLHSHIARTPPAPHTLRHQVPVLLSQLVLKLLHKMAEGRYQSAYGLRRDLEECLRRWQDHQKIEGFALGRADRPGELRLPQRLYGRQAELAQLHGALERVRGGALELVLVPGAAGIGKTALVSELFGPIATGGGYMVRAGFDAQQQGIPYGPLLRACRDLLRIVLGEPTLVLQERREQILSALEGSGRILTDLLPELELIIGPQPKVAELPPLESQNRFGRLFQSFLRLFAGGSHPLVLFLDNLDWGDAASLNLIRLLLTDPYGHHMLVVACYRDSAGEGPQPLSQLLAAVRKERVAVTQIALQPLGLPDVAELLAEALSTPATELTALSAEILRKAHGNPFFVCQFLTSLYKEGLLQYSARSGSWQWDLSRIRALSATDNVADFLIAKLQQLGPKAQQLLRQAACIGLQFDLPTLAEISGESVAQCAAVLSEVLRAGVLVQIDSGNLVYAAPEPSVEGAAPLLPAEAATTYKFLHERLHQAVYAALDEMQRQQTHLRIGRRLLARLRADEPAETLFDCVNHLNQGSPCLRGAEGELRELARLNFLAGQRAKATIAFAAAAEFFGRGAALLPESAWESEYELLFNLHLERAQCELLSGRLAEAESALQGTLELARRPIDKALVCLRWCELCYTQGDCAESTRRGLQGLAYLGVSMPGPDEDAFAAFLAERAEIAALLAGRRIADLVSLPKNESPEIDVALKIIVALISPAYVLASPLYPLLVARQLTLALRSGVTEDTGSAASAYGFLIATVLGEPAEGYEFGELGIALCERLPNLSASCHVRLTNAVYYHLFRPIKECLAHLQKAREEGLASGAFADLSGSCSSLACISVYTAEDYNVALADCQESVVLLQYTKHTLSESWTICVRQLFRALLGTTAEPTSLSDPEFDEAALWREYRESGLKYGLVIFAWVKLHLLYLFGQIDEACALGLESEPWLVSSAGLPQATDHVFLICLSLLAGYPRASAADQVVYEEHIERLHQQLRTWSGHCAANYLHRERLVAAERARLGGRSVEAFMLYDEAIAAAHRNGFPLHEALAHELCGRCHAAAERDKLASYYLTEAVYAYSRLGATAKVTLLLSQHPEHLRAETRPLQDRMRGEGGGRGTTSTPRSHSSTEDHLDVNAVLRATEVISREREIDKAIDQVLQAMLASAGSQRGFLILDRNGTLQIEAARTISPDASRTGLGIPIDGPGRQAAAEELALSVVHYVVRTREVVILDAAAAARFANDPYLLKHKPQAVLCLPLVSQSRLTGVLYLENSVAQVTFTAGRIDLLRILSAQAATALENALLLHRVSETTEKLKRTNEVLEAQIAQRTAEIQRSYGEVQDANQRLQVELTERSKAERERAAMQEQMLQAQRARVAELSTPLIPISEKIMVMPLIGTMDAERAAQVLEVALNGVQHSGARVVIIDITGLKHMDTHIAGSLLKAAKALRLLGAKAILTGIRAEVAQTLVGLGVELGDLDTRSTLQSGIAYAYRAMGMTSPS